MSIRPVDFSGMIQNSQEVGALRQAENQRPAVEQQTMQINADQQLEIKKEQVNATEDKDDEHRYDASEGEGGQAQYHQTRGKKKKQAIGEGEGDRVVVKGQGGGFNITI